MHHVAILAKVEGVVKGAVKIIVRLTYRQRYAQSMRRDPLLCPHCRREMGVWRIWHPTDGVIDDEGEVINGVPTPQPPHEPVPEQGVKVEESAHRALCTGGLADGVDSE